MNKNIAKLLLILTLVSSVFITVGQTTYYVATDGSDSNSGTESNPFKTIKKAYSVLSPGDSAIVMPGTYTEDIVLENNSGSEGNLITIIGSDNTNKPILTGGVFMKNCSYMKLKSFEITVTRIRGERDGFHHNIFENLDVHHITDYKGADLQGFSIWGGAHHNLLLNCDFHNNVDFTGSQADGMGFSTPKRQDGGPNNNIVRYCRSYFNNDDGFDTWWSGDNNRYEGCWSFGNGKDEDFNDIVGNGNGFKLGQGEYNRPVLVNCVAFKNKERGFDENSNQLGETKIYNCTSWDNDNNNFGFWATPNTDTVINCISFDGGGVSMPADAVTTINNNWDLDIEVTADDFISMDYTEIMAPRKADGSLPDVNFLKLKSTSKLINLGIEVGLPYIGVAPDLGAFEYEGVVENPPVAKFSVSSKSVFLNDDVQFTDKSTYNPKSWEWTFEGATPATSIAKNPTVTYTAIGTYDVTLVVTNADGSDTKSVSNYITVAVNPLVPVANFIASDTLIAIGSRVDFTDISTNEPTSWYWSFEGGTPASSIAQNGGTRYNAVGTFDVTLTVKNEGGTNTKIIKDMIVVDSTISSINKATTNSLKLSNYPNPFTKETTINYTITEKSTVRLVVLDTNGKTIANIVNKIQQPGNYQANWNVGELKPGIYLIDLNVNTTHAVQKAIIKEH